MPEMAEREVLMINTTTSYKINFVKKSAKGNTMFSIRDYDKDKPDEKNYLNVVAFNSIVLQDGDFIIIDKISSLSVNQYTDRQGNPKTSVTIFGIVKQSVAPVKKEAPEQAPPPSYQAPNEYEPVVDISNDDFNTGPLMDISSDDLPF